MQAGPTPTQGECEAMPSPVLYNHRVVMPSPNITSIVRGPLTVVALSARLPTWGPTPLPGVT